MIAVCAGSELRPVLRRPRGQWRIPARQVSRTASPTENARLAISWEGTTPEGRELFRKLWHRTSVLIVQGKEPKDVATEVRAWLERFPELYSEFVSIFCRLCHQDNPPVELPPQNLATLIALRAALEHAAHRNDVD